MKTWQYLIPILRGRHCTVASGEVNKLKQEVETIEQLQEQLNELKQELEQMSADWRSVSQEIQASGQTTSPATGVTTDQQKMQAPQAKQQAFFQPHGRRLANTTAPCVKMACSVSIPTHAVPRWRPMSPLFLDHHR